jgi:hypothetical protein
MQIKEGFYVILLFDLYAEHLLFGWIHSMPEHTFSAITTDSNTKLNY